MKDNLNTLFEHLKDDFDIERPDFGHESRFLEKLNAQNNPSKSRKTIWKSSIGIAATVIICFGLFTIFSQQLGFKELASVSPEMAETQALFTNVISRELSKLDSEETPEFQELIVDALFEIKILEENYKQLALGLNENPDDDLIISAMILNFQDRVKVLEDVMDEIENAKKLNINNTLI